MQIIELKNSKRSVVRAVRAAADALRRGGVVVFPTDTVYGLGVHIYDKDALHRLFALKGRRESKPSPVFVGNLQAAKKLAMISERQEPFLKAHWPGALTAVFRSKKRMDPRVARRGKIGLRVPGHRFLLALLYEVKFPITGTSANISGEPPCRSAKAFLRQLKYAKRAVLPDVVIDAGALPRRKPSTVVEFSGSRIKILRRGSVRL